ncbi:MAG: hypothetical protein J2P37_04185 [Ktedonobacteraceae bacterium]|nr:hypothetical protein [Ktedonobacteraceae bacterium]MBO0790521.1 hypothetical protein [Ktedonobacteraceae bacterium]
MEETTGRKWLKRILNFINPLHDPSLIVAAVLTVIEEAGQNDAWYTIAIIALVNWLAVRGVVWLVVNFTFAVTFLSRRLWWAVKNPFLAWRILDAVGHEEIIIGGFPSLADGGIILEDGTMLPGLAASGIHIVGELPAGTEVPMLNMPNGQVTADLTTMASTGMLPALNPGNFANNGYDGQSTASFQQNGYFGGAQSTEGLAPGFSQRPSAAEEQMRQQVEALARLLDDWLQHTEEKWRTVSDSQLGWKPLRGRWSSWDDIFQDAYASKAADPMTARAAQSAADATARRFETSKDKGSAASAVACFMRDMMTLRNAMDLVSQGNTLSETSGVQPIVQPPHFGGDHSSSLLGGNRGTGPRNSLIRRPTQIFVDADTEK